MLADSLPAPVVYCHVLEILQTSLNFGEQNWTTASPLYKVYIRV